MVIQRQWRISSFGGSSSGNRPAIAPLENTNQISSSEDSNESSCWANPSRAKETEDPNKCPETLLKDLNERLFKSQFTEKGAIRSLELLRMNLQSSFDREIDTIVRKYKEQFFLAAYRNIQSNLGDSSISEEDLYSVLKKMVQQSGVQYSAPPTTTSKSLAIGSTGSTGALFDLSDSDGSLDKDIPALPLFNTTFQKYSPFPMWKSSSSMLDQSLKRKPSPIFEDEPPAALPVKVKKGSSPSTSSTFDILHSTLTRPSSSIPSSTSSSAKAKWNTLTVTKDSRFVLDIEANKLFNVIDLRDRVTVKHPELIRYTPDIEDMNWLMNENLVPMAQRHMTIQLLLRDEVAKLKKEKQSDWNSSDLPGFKVSDLMIRKMHKYFTELNVRRHKIRSNSGYFDMKFSEPKEGTVKNLSGNSSSGQTSKFHHSLSTSHATLSALLSNCSSDFQDN